MHVLSQYLSVLSYRIRTYLVSRPCVRVCEMCDIFEDS